MKNKVISVLSALTGVALGAGIVGKVTGKSLNKVRSMSDKHFALFQMMNQWVKVKQEGKNLALYFEKNEYKKIAIYGMSYAGETLMDVVVTAITFFDEIEENLSEKMDCPIISLEDILYEV